MTRRILAALALTALMACSRRGPDLIIHNAKVFTGDQGQLWVQALAITGDRVTAIGDSKVVVALAGTGTRQIDAGGRTVVPGFNDAHQHVGVSPPSDSLDLPFDPTLEQIGDALKTQVKTSAAGRLIEGTFAARAWEDARFTRAWLDAIAPDHPVRLIAFTGHGMLVNSRALALIGIDESARDPEGGSYGRDAQGRLDGRLVEYAEFLANRRLAMKQGPDAAVDAYRRFAAEARSYGITSVHLMEDALPIDTAVKYLVQADLPMRIRTYRFPMRDAGGDTADSKPPVPPQPTPLIDTRGMKWILDGTPVERLAFLTGPYADRPGERGRMDFSSERLAQFVGWAYGTEDPLAVHAVGDGAIEAYVAAVEKAGRAEVWRQKRPRIEHGDLMPPTLIARVKAMGMVVVENPLHFTLGDVFLARFGAERAAMMQPMRSLVDAGVPLAIGSDGPLNPFVNILLASTHPANPKEALTREQAVSAYTTGSAFAEFKENEKGRLAVGQLADLAVLSADVFTVPPPELPKIRSELTILGGRIIHESGAVR